MQRYPGHLLHASRLQVAQFFFWRADNCFGKFKVLGLSFRWENSWRTKWIPNTPRVSFGPSTKIFGSFFFGWFRDVSDEDGMGWKSRLVEYYSIWSGIFLKTYIPKSRWRKKTTPKFGGNLWNWSQDFSTKTWEWRSPHGGLLKWWYPPNHPF